MGQSSNVSFRPSEQTASLFFLQKSALPLGYAQVSETPRRRSGRPDSNRHVLRVGSIRVDETRAHARSRTGFTPRTKRVLDHREAWARTHAYSACGERAAQTHQQAPKGSTDEVEAPAEGIEPPRDRLTAGCLTIRLRWNETARPRACSTSAPRTRTSLSKRQVFREHGPRAGLPASGLVPGAGVEPAFLESETSVLPARRSRSDESGV